MHPLNTKWVLWFHNPVDSDWSVNSYMNVYTLESLENFWEVYNSIRKSNIENGMFFLMRENIKPMWEDAKNKDGGCWSFKISKKSVFDSWLDVSINCINETLFKDIEKSKSITGISISPKKMFCIIKIWNNDKNQNDKSLLNTNMFHMNINESLYKAHCNR